MLEKSIETVMKKSGRNILIPADLVATVNENNNLQHAFLVLTKTKYAKIPVLDNDNHFKGLISLAMVTEKMLKNSGIDAGSLESFKIKDVMQRQVIQIHDKADLEEIMSNMLAENFLPYVNEKERFLGIITRREILKEMNFLSHNFSKYYVALPVYEMPKRIEAKIKK